MYELFWVSVLQQCTHAEGLHYICAKVVRLTVIVKYQIFKLFYFVFTTIF